MTKNLTPLVWTDFDRQNQIPTETNDEDFTPLFSFPSSNDQFIEFSHHEEDNPNAQEPVSNFEELALINSIKTDFDAVIAKKNEEIALLLSQKTSLEHALTHLKDRTLEISRTLVFQLLEQMKGRPIHLTSEYWEQACIELFRYMDSSKNIEITCHSFARPSLLNLLPNILTDFVETQIHTDDTLETGQIIFTETHKNKTATILMSDVCQHLMDVISSTKTSL